MTFFSLEPLKDSKGQWGWLVAWGGTRVQADHSQAGWVAQEGERWPETGTTIRGEILSAWSIGYFLSWVKEGSHGASCLLGIRQLCWIKLGWFRSLWLFSLTIKTLFLCLFSSDGAVKWPKHWKGNKDWSSKLGADYTLHFQLTRPRN